MINQDLLVLSLAYYCSLSLKFNLLLEGIRLAFADGFKGKEVILIVANIAIALSVIGPFLNPCFDCCMQASAWGREGSLSLICLSIEITSFLSSYNLGQQFMVSPPQPGAMGCEGTGVGGWWGLTVVPR